MKFPADPFMGVRVNVYVAVCPPETVLLDGPVVPITKSNPIPETAT